MTSWTLAVQNTGWERGRAVGSVFPLFLPIRRGAFKFYSLSFKLVCFMDDIPQTFVDPEAWRSSPFPPLRTTPR